MSEHRNNIRSARREQIRAGIDIPGWWPRVWRGTASRGEAPTSWLCSPIQVDAVGFGAARRLKLAWLGTLREQGRDDAIDASPHQRAKEIYYADYPVWRSERWIGTVRDTEREDPDRRCGGLSPGDRSRSALEDTWWAAPREGPPKRIEDEALGRCGTSGPPGDYHWLSDNYRGWARYWCVCGGCGGPRYEIRRDTGEVMRLRGDHVDPRESCHRVRLFHVGERGAQVSVSILKERDPEARICADSIDVRTPDRFLRMDDWPKPVDWKRIVALRAPCDELRFWPRLPATGRVRPIDRGIRPTHGVSELFADPPIDAWRPREGFTQGVEAHHSLRDWWSSGVRNDTVPGRRAPKNDFVVEAVQEADAVIGVDIRRVWIPTGDVRVDSFEVS